MSKVLTRAAIKAAIAAGVPEGKSQIALWDAKPVGLGLRLLLAAAPVGSLSTGRRVRPEARRRAR